MYRLLSKRTKSPAQIRAVPQVMIGCLCSLVSSDVSLFLDLSTLERNSLIEEKNTPYECSTTSEDVTPTVPSKSTLVATAPQDSQNTAQPAKSGSKKRPSMTHLDDSNLPQSAHKRKHSETSSPSKKAVVLEP